MKKIVMLLFVVMVGMSAKAQVYMGGTLGLWHNDDTDATSFTLAPEVGYELNQQWAIGASLVFKHTKANEKDRSFGFAPYVRYSFFEHKSLRLFADGCLGISSTKHGHADSEAGFELGIKPGLAVKLTDHFSLVTKWGFLGYRDDYMQGQDGYGFSFSSEDLSIGFHYAF